MPIFEYSCFDCGSHFEKLHKSRSDQEINCPECGSLKIKKELSVFASVGSPSSDKGCSSGG
jgi:putative FmdB family regulatory protein